MSRRTIYYLKRNNIYFPTKTAFQKHLKDIRNRAKQNFNGEILDKNDLNDLKDFIEDFSDKRDYLCQNIDISKCHFILRKSPNYSTDCLYVIDKNTGFEEQISTTRFGNPPSDLENFCKCLRYAIRNDKLQKRQIYADREGKCIDQVDLWHVDPNFKELVAEFQALQGLDDLSVVVTPNIGRHNVPELLPDYQYLENEFLDFYKNRVTAYELRTRR